MADQTRGRDRRSFWSVFTVEEGFKRRQVARLLLLTALNVVVSTAAFVALQDSGDLGSWGGLQWEAPHLLRMAAGWAALLAGLGGLFALSLGLLMTHRMAGPIHVFKRELRRIEQGQPPRRIRVRPRDELADVAEALNAAIDTLWARSCDVSQLELDIDRVRATHDEILDAVESLDPSGLPDPQRARLEDWRDRMRALREKLASEAPSA